VRQRSSAPPHAIATAAFHPRAIPRPRGVEREPVIQRAALALQAAARKAAGTRPFRTVTAWPNGHRWAAAFTHDLDVVSWWPAFTLLRMVELARKGALRTPRTGCRGRDNDAGFDPVTQGVEDVTRSIVVSIPTTP